MAKQESPWTPSPDLLDLEFQRKTLEDIDTLIRKFAKEKDITYEIEKKPDSITLTPQIGNFAALHDYLTQTIQTLNETLKNQKKNFSFVVDDQLGKLVVRAKHH